MLTFSGPIGKNKAWELTLLHPFRSLKDGVTWLTIEVNSDWFRGDHNPQTSLWVVVLNLTIIEFRVYDTRHVDNEG